MIVLVVVAVFLPRYPGLGALPVPLDMLVQVALGAVLYGMSHASRAARLAILAAPTLKLHVRTVILLHFHAAPVSLLVPFKLGELYRLQQLAAVSGDTIRSVMILLLERTLDAVVLITVVSLVLVSNRPLPENLTPISVIMAAATAVALLTFVVAPPGLRAIQLHILMNHSAPRAQLLLRFVHSVRMAITTASDCLHGNVPLLLLLSALIWALEGAALVALAPKLASQVGVFIITALSFALSADTGEPAAVAIARLYAFTAVVVVLSVWPLAVVMFNLRLGLPRRGVVEPPRPLSAAVPRRVRLHGERRVM